MRIIQAESGEVLFLGRTGENLAAEVRFPAGDWIRNYGEGTFQLLIRRCGDSVPYPAAVQVASEDGEAYLSWPVTAADLRFPGPGACELDYYVGDALAKSETWETEVASSLGDTGEVPPRAHEGWVAEVLRTGSEVTASNAAAEALLDRALSAAEQTNETAAALMEGYAHPFCEVGTWNRTDDGAGGWNVEKKNHGKKVRTADFLRYSYPVAVELGEGYRAAGYYRDGTYISPASDRIRIPADTEFVLIVTAEEEPEELLTEADAAEYARAVRILSKTALEVASVAESLGTVSASVLSAVAAVAQAEEMLADRMTGLLDGVFSPVCEIGTWSLTGGEVVQKSNIHRVRTSGWLSLGYDAVIEPGDGYRISGYREDGSYIGWKTAPFTVPAGTAVCFNISLAGGDTADTLTEEDVPAYAAALRILTRPAALAVTAGEAAEALRHSVEENTEALEEAEDRVAEMKAAVRGALGVTEADYLANAGTSVSVPASAEAGDPIPWQTPSVRTNFSWLLAEDVIPGEKFRVTLTAGNSALPFAWLTADGALIEKSPSTALTNEVLTAPAGAAMLVLNFRTDLPHAAERLSSLGSRVSAAESALENLTVREDQIEGATARRRARFDGRFLSVAYSLADGDPGRINTAAHFEFCGREAGYAALKGDVAPTSDGLIMSHDAGYTLTEGGLIMTYNAASSVPWHSVTTAAATALRHAGTLDPVITVDEYLRICKKHGKIAYITIRDQYMEEAVPRLLAALDKYRMREHCIVNSFTYASLEAVRAADEDIYLSWVLASSTTLKNSIVDAADALGAAMVTAFDYPNFGREGALTDAVLAYARSKDVRICESLLTTSEDIAAVQRRGLAGAQMKLPE